MDNKQTLLIENKNPHQSQNKTDNMNFNSKILDQNKNLNESMITTSTSSVSVNNKKNLQHTNYKTPKKKIFQIPIPNQKNQKQLNTKNLQNKMKNQNAFNNLIYTKGTVKKSNNNNINDTINNHGKTKSKTPIEIDNKKNPKNNLLFNNKNQLYSQLEINSNHNQNVKYKNLTSLNKKKLNINNDINNEINYFSNNEEDNNISIINNTIIQNDNTILANDLPKKKPLIHKTILKEYDNKFSSGYYSESDQRKEKRAVLNIEEI